MPRVKTVSDELLLDKALVVLLEHGPHRFTLPRVGGAVGLSPSTLLQRFGSKRGLMDRVFARATVQLQASLDAAPATGDPRADLVSWLAALARPIRTRAHVASNLALLIEDLTDDDRFEAANAHIDVIRSGINRHLVAMGSEHVADHVDMVEAHWHGLLIQWSLRGDGPAEAWMTARLGALIDVLLPQAD